MRIAATCQERRRKKKVPIMDGMCVNVSKMCKRPANGGRGRQFEMSSHAAAQAAKRFAPSSVVIKNLVRVLQNSVNNPHLPSSISDVRASAGAHESGAEDNGEVLRVHPVDA